MCCRTTVFLPVWVDGALFRAGDEHAAQGDGEVDINAIETCLEGQFRLTARTDFALPLPIAVTPSHLITMGFHEDLDAAARIAVQSLLDLLKTHDRVAWRDAYRLASIAADLPVTQVVNGEKGIYAMLERVILNTSRWRKLGRTTKLASLSRYPPATSTIWIVFSLIPSCTRPRGRSSVSQRTIT